MKQILCLILSIAESWRDGVGREIEPYALDEISPLEEYVHRPGKIKNTDSKIIWFLPIIKI